MDLEIKPEDLMNEVGFDRIKAAAKGDPGRLFWILDAMLPELYAREDLVRMCISRVFALTKALLLSHPDEVRAMQPEKDMI